MLAFLRRRRAAFVARTTFSDSRSEVCTPDCHVAASYHRMRTTALSHVTIR
jgi:hypothetical protein